MKSCETCRHFRPTIRGGECVGIEALFDEGLNARQLPEGGALVDGGDDASIAGDVRLIVSPDFGCALHQPAPVCLVHACWCRECGCPEGAA